MNHWASFESPSHAHSRSIHGASGRLIACRCVVGVRLIAATAPGQSASRTGRKTKFPRSTKSFRTFSFSM
eukprot:7489679-Heterocapsa_arctica.AAC.1